MNPLLILCQMGIHSWPRVHGDWREIVVEPAEAECRRCEKAIQSLWRAVYPKDGSRCLLGSCEVHDKKKPEGAAKPPVVANKPI